MLNKAKLRQEIERERRKAVRARLRELRKLVREAQRARREAIALIRVDCRRQREALRAACHGRIDAARREGAEQIAERMAAVEEERRTDQNIRAADTRYKKLAAKRSTSAERRQESDDEVRANIPEALVPVFNVVRRHIKGGPRKTRSEAFLEWVEENPGEVYAIQERDAERYLAQLLAEQERAERLYRRASVAGVPF